MAECSVSDFAVALAPDGHLLSQLSEPPRGRITAFETPLESALRDSEADQLAGELHCFNLERSS